MLLDGIDGSHLLGFMGALGTLRLLDEAAALRGDPHPTLSFDRSGTAIIDRVGDEPGALVQALVDRLRPRRDYYAEVLGDLNKPADFTCASFASFAWGATGWQRHILAGLACSTGAAIVESSLCAANGASHQELIRSIRDVLSLVRSEHLCDALFRRWRRSYAIPKATRKELDLGDRKPTLRLEPTDDRLYALRATNPTSADDYKTELGAQVLAVPAIELLPTCPQRRPICIASRAPSRTGRVFFQWSLWEVPATLAAVRSVLAAGPGSADASGLRGVFSAYEVARVTGDKGKLTMTPTRGLWWCPSLPTDRRASQPPPVEQSASVTPFWSEDE